MARSLRAGWCLLSLAVLAGAAGCTGWPSPAGGTRTVLLLTPEWSSPDEVAEESAGVRDAFSEAGYGPDRLRVELRLTRTGGEAAVADIGRALNDANPAVVITTTMDVAREVSLLRPGLPVAFSGASDPVRSCLVDSLVRPGRGASGYASDIDAEAKMLEALRDAFPDRRRVTVLVDGNVSADWFECSPEEVRAQARALELRGCRPGPVHDLADLALVVEPPSVFIDPGRELGLKVDYHRVCGWGDIERFAADWRGADRAVLVPNLLLTQRHAPELTALFNRRAIPAIYEGRRFVAAGGLMAIGPRKLRRSLQETSEVALLALAGHDLSTTPVRTPVGVDLWINVRAARASGLRPSTQVLQRADELIR